MPDAALNLYIALVKVPKHESEAGDLVPFCASKCVVYYIGRLNIIYLVSTTIHTLIKRELISIFLVMMHNNSYYLAHQAGFNFPMCEEKVPELRAKASQAYSFMMRSVRSSLNCLIAEAMAKMTNEGKQVLGLKNE